MKLGQIVGAAVLVLGGWIAGSASGCSSARADAEDCKCPEPKPPPSKSVECEPINQGEARLDFGDITPEERARITVVTTRTTPTPAGVTGGVAFPFWLGGVALVGCEPGTPVTFVGP